MVKSLIEYDLDDLIQNWENHLLSLKQEPSFLLRTKLWQLRKMPRHKTLPKYIFYGNEYKKQIEYEMKRRSWIHQLIYNIADKLPYVHKTSNVMNITFAGYCFWIININKYGGTLSRKDKLSVLVGNYEICLTPPIKMVHDA